MAKIRKSFIGAFLCLVMLLVGVCALTACGSKDLTVTFSIEGKEQTVEVVDGKVTFPADPEKEYYEFRGWYSTDTFEEGTEFTKDTEIKESVTVYAYFAPVYVNISVNGSASEEIKLENLSSKTTDYTADAESKNLTFDGWYIDAGYGTEYTTQDVDDLYARYVATVTFDNGYETVYTEKVQVNTSVSQPAASDIVKYYMDEEDISYVDNEGNTFSFPQEINENTVVNVLWKTPHLEYSLISGTASNYVLTGVKNEYRSVVGTYPVISVLSRNVTVDDSGTVGNVVAVEGFSTGYLMNNISGANTLILHDGIQYISRLSGVYNSLLKEIRLPETIKIMEDSFSYFPALTSINLPEGLEVVINCFWKDNMGGTESDNRINGYDFDVVIPASVTTLSNVPYSTLFAEGSPYYKEDNRIYKQTDNGGKILVSDYQTNVGDDGKLIVPNGVTGIQVGVLSHLDFDNLYLPSSFNSVEYNAERSDYSEIYTGNLLTIGAYVASPSGSGMNSYAYAIVSTLSSIKYVVFDSREYPSGLNGNAFLFTSGTTPYTQLDETKLVYVAEVESGTIDLEVVSLNTMSDGSKNTDRYSVETGSEVTKEGILEEIGLTEENLGVSINVTVFTQLGDDFVDGVKNSNQYIYIEYEYDVLGFTYTVNDDNTVTVTGFDSSTARELENGTYLVYIPEYMQGYPVTEIADGAFKDVARISKIYIPATVSKIGAQAFMNTSNLEYVFIAAGGLEEIGESAFENIGCILENGSYIKNPSIANIATLNSNKTVTAVHIEVPLAKMRSIGANAFKSVAIVQFTAVEEDRALTVEASKAMQSGSFLSGSVVANGFYFMGDNRIVKYLSTEKIEAYSHVNGANMEKDEHRVQLIAIAAYSYLTGNTASIIPDTLALGYSWGGLAKTYATVSTTLANACEKEVITFEVMEGSVYFVKKIDFVSVSKIHENAFSDIDTDNLTVYVYKVGEESYVSLDDVKNQSAEIFEEGWLNGLSNADNTALMAEAQESDSYMSIG